MKYDEFVGIVQDRARLASRGEAVRAIRASLETLGERLYGGEAEDLAAQLPQEISLYLKRAETGHKYSLDEFINRVAQKEKVDKPDALFHIRAVMSVLIEAVTPAEMLDVLAQLPEEYSKLVESGSEGKIDLAD